MARGALYWLADDALIQSTDKGATWKKLGAVKGGRTARFSARTAKHLFVLTNDGIVESRDGGASWATRSLCRRK